MHAKIPDTPSPTDPPKMAAHYPSQYAPADYYTGGGAGATAYGYQDAPVQEAPGRQEYELEHQRPRHELS